MGSKKKTNKKNIGDKKILKADIWFGFEFQLTHLPHATHGHKT